MLCQQLFQVWLRCRAQFPNILFVRRIPEAELPDFCQCNSSYFVIWIYVRTSTIPKTAIGGYLNLCYRQQTVHVISWFWYGYGLAKGQFMLLVGVQENRLFPISHHCLITSLIICLTRVQIHLFSFILLYQIWLNLTNVFKSLWRQETGRWTDVTERLSLKETS